MLDLKNIQQTIDDFWWDSPLNTVEELVLVTRLLPNRDRQDKKTQVVKFASIDIIFFFETIV